MPIVNDEMKSCIAECLHCYQTCLSTAMGHCLEIGGQHTEPKHFTLMMACAEICRTSAHFMLLGSELHKLTCRERLRSLAFTVQAWRLWNVPSY